MMLQTRPQQLPVERMCVHNVKHTDDHPHAAMLEQWCEQAVRLAYHITRDREAALDVSQDAVVKAISALPESTNAVSGKAWFMRIVVNLCRDWLRHQTVERKAMDEWRTQVTAKTGDAAGGAERKEQLERTRKAMLSLPLAYREALALVAVEGCSTQEAAVILNVPDGTLRWRLSEARALLQAELKRMDGE